MRLLIAALFLGLTTHAYAQPQPPPPEVEALGRMLGDAQQREFLATARAVVAERRATAAEAKLAAQPAAKGTPE